MQGEQFNPGDPGKLPGHEARTELPASSQSSRREGEGEWADIGRQIERQLRRDVARLVGAEDGDDWSRIKDALLERVRGQTESVDRTEIGRRVSEVGREVEERIRGGLAGTTGAGRDADWSMIGRTLRERVERLLDPSERPYPGGSGTGSSAEDASVPAARPSADTAPTPAPAGGEDTGLPTVTTRVDAPTPRPPAE
jgi:hypothetical protein